MVEFHRPSLFQEVLQECDATLQSEMVRAAPKFYLRNPHFKYEVLVSSHVSYVSCPFSLPSQKSACQVSIVAPETVVNNLPLEDFTPRYGKVKNYGGSACLEASSHCASTRRRNLERSICPSYNLIIWVWHLVF